MKCLLAVVFAELAQGLALSAASPPSVLRKHRSSTVRAEQALSVLPSLQELTTNSSHVWANMDSNLAQINQRLDAQVAQRAAEASQHRRERQVELQKRSEQIAEVSKTNAVIKSHIDSLRVNEKMLRQEAAELKQYAHLLGEELTRQAGNLTVASEFLATALAEGHRHIFEDRAVEVLHDLSATEKVESQKRLYESQFSFLAGPPREPASFLQTSGPDGASQVVQSMFDELKELKRAQHADDEAAEEKFESRRSELDRQRDLLLDTQEKLRTAESEEVEKTEKILQAVFYLKGAISALKEKSVALKVFAAHIGESDAKNASQLLAGLGAGPKWEVNPSGLLVKAIKSQPRHVERPSETPQAKTAGKSKH